jgi:peptide/nickel transport system substrate-binding protein
MRKLNRLVMAATLGISGLALPALAGEEIRTIELFTRPQASQPAEFQSIQLIAQEWRKLGLDVDIKVMPWEQLSTVVWFERDSWDTTAWQMVGRPERSDPDELVYNLFHSSTAAKGYNFIGYNNPEYDKVVEAQRITVDPEKRRALIFKSQEILAADQPNMMLVHPKTTFAYDKTVWDPASVVEQSGIGIRNTWTFIGLKPLGAQKDIILNTSDNVIAINPLYISGGVDTWIQELMYDRLLRVGPDGLPTPWAAESYEWKDDLNIEVKLRAGMEWHDGKPLTAQDVKFSFDATVSGEAPMFKPFGTNIANIEIVDDLTVIFTLKKASASFTTSSLSKINLIPKHIWEPILADLAGKEDNAESYQETTPIGSGAFRFTRWLPNEEVVLTANPDHFAAPAVDRWILRTVPNSEAALGMLRSGEINFLSDFGGDPKILKEAAATDGDLEVVSTIDIGFRYVAFNNRRPPFDDPAFRRALSVSVDRRLIVNAAFKGYAIPSNGVVSPALEFWYDKAVVDNFKTGGDLAASILKEAGYKVEGGRLHYPGDIKETLGK